MEKEAEKENEKPTTMPSDQKRPDQPWWASDRVMVAPEIVTLASSPW